MADTQLHTHTQDIEITAPQTKDVVIGSPMDKGGIITITENGKHVVSGYDIADVDVKLPSQTKEVMITTNGTTEVTPDDGRVLEKVVVKAQLLDIASFELNDDDVTVGVSAYTMILPFLNEQNNTLTI